MGSSSEAKTLLLGHECPLPPSLLFTACLAAIFRTSCSCTQLCPRATAGHTTELPLLTCLVTNHGLLARVLQHTHQHRDGPWVPHLAQAVG